MRNKWIIILLLLLTLALVNCEQGDGNGQNGEQPDNPIPVLNTISPNSKVSHLPSFTLTATGSSFVSGSKIVFNDSEKQTTYVSSTELTCQIDPADISSSAVLKTDSLSFPEKNSEVAIVKVRNPSPGGGDSNSLDFLIQSNHTFYVPKNISNNSGHSYAPCIAVDSEGNINVAWHDYTPGDPEIYYSHSEGNGTSWTQTHNVSSNSGKSYTPCIATDSEGNINVLWYDNTTSNYEILYSRSENNGTSWSPHVNVSNNAGTSYVADIDIDSSGNIHTTWYDSTPGNWDILYARSENNGTNWTPSPPKNVSETSGNSSQPAIATNSAGNIHLLWHDYTPGNWEIFYSRSENNGASWTQPKNISNNSGSSQAPEIAVDSEGNINVVWNDNTPGQFDIFYCRSTSNGNNWTQPKKISDNSGYSVGPTINIDSAGNINVVWCDDTPGHMEILYARSIDNGNSWTSPLNISNTSGASWVPKIDTDSAGNINVVFYDNTPGNNDIFFTNSTR